MKSGFYGLDCWELCFWDFEKWNFISIHGIALLFCVLIHKDFVAPGKRLWIFYLSKILCPHQTTCWWFSRYKPMTRNHCYVDYWNWIFAQRFRSFPEAVGSKRIHSCIKPKLFNKNILLTQISKCIATKGQSSLTDHGPP